MHHVDIGPRHGFRQPDLMLAIRKFAFLMSCQPGVEMCGNKSTKVFAPAKREKLQFPEGVASLLIRAWDVLAVFPYAKFTSSATMPALIAIKGKGGPVD
jgi:hypothetical protein